MRFAIPSKPLAKPYFYDAFHFVMIVSRMASRIINPLFSDVANCNNGLFYIVDNSTNALFRTPRPYKPLTTSKVW